jgi:ketosteroid isomerase-like protein
VTASDTVASFYAARRDEDVRMLGCLLDPNVLWHRPGTTTIEYNRADDVVSSIASVAELGRASQLLVTPRDYLEAGETVACLVTWATASPATTIGDELAIYRIADGRIAEAFFYPSFAWERVRSATG